MADGNAGADPAPGRPDRERDRILAETNDTTALNGGPARHWFQPGVDEPLETPRRGVKLGVAIGVWGMLAVAVLLLLVRLR
jgi:hypothetical protein